MFTSHHSHGGMEPTCTAVPTGEHTFAAATRGNIAAFFLFLYILKTFLQKYILSFTIYSFIPLPPGRRAAGGLPPLCGAASPLPSPYRAVGTYM